jgi:hypothetical protein
MAATAAWGDSAPSRLAGIWAAWGRTAAIAMTAHASTAADMFDRPRARRTAVSIERRIVELWGIGTHAPRGDGIAAAPP